MKIDLVLDTSALVAYWQKERGHDRVRAALREKGCAMHAVNVMEYLTVMPRRQPARFTVASAAHWLDRSGIACVEGTDARFRTLAASVRLADKALSMGDGVAVALAATIGAPLMVAEKAFERVSKFARIDLIR